MSDERLQAIASELVQAIIQPDDRRQLRVTLTFNARRDETGIWISPITLGYEQKKKAPTP